MKEYIEDLAENSSNEYKRDTKLKTKILHFGLSILPSDKTVDY